MANRPTATNLRESADEEYFRTLQSGGEIHEDDVCQCAEIIDPEYTPNNSVLSKPSSSKQKKIRRCDLSLWSI